jgi:hypothetical protein
MSDDSINRRILPKAVPVKKRLVIENVSVDDHLDCGGLGAAAERSLPTDGAVGS